MKRVWMIDSDPVFLAGAGIALQNQNMETTLFSDPFAFLRELCNGELPNLIVLDSRLASVDTMDILRVLCTSPRFAHIPRIVMIGGPRFDDLRGQALLAGATDVIRRDVTARIFNAVVKIRLSEAAGMSVTQFQRCVMLNAA